MKSVRDRLVPHMQHYTFWLPDQPYVMYFQEPNESTEVSNTDRLGFRITDCGRATTSPGSAHDGEPVGLLAGSSSAYGVGASANSATIASRLWAEHTPNLPWFNFAGQAFNSAQELTLLTLSLHELPPVREIILYSGVNELVLSRVPEKQQGIHGAYFQCEPPSEDAVVPSADERITIAADRTASHLHGWQVIAAGLRARLVFALQPLAPWVREVPAKQEQRLFDELDKASNFRGLHNDIAPMAIGRQYAAALDKHCRSLGIEFVDTNQLLAERVKRIDWLFVDRVHMTDAGYDLAAQVLAAACDLS